VPGEDFEEAVAKLQPLAEASCEPGGSVALEPISDLDLHTYTGEVRQRTISLPGYLLPADHPVVASGHAALEQGLGRRVAVKTWGFCTDAPHLMAAGVPTVGFAPAVEGVPHTAQDHVRIDKLEEAYRGNIALAAGLGSAKL
jgi:acetylornithine deacetylase/succinyl-diaminopimelate desuccinylase-like protein